VSPFVVNLIFQTANFLVLALALGWLFFKPIRRTITERREKLAAEVNEAASKLAAAETARAEAERRVKELAVELGGMETRAKEAAAQQTAKILAEARARIETERVAFESSLAGIELARVDAQAEALATIAGGLVSRLLTEIAGPDLDHALLRMAVRELETRPVPAAKGRAGAANGAAAVVVESAAPIPLDDRAAIERALGSAGTAVKYRDNPDLIGGLRVAGPFGMVDASVAGLSRFAEVALRERYPAEVEHDEPHVEQHAVAR